MGYNTAMIVRNDHLHEIKRDTDFGYKVWDAISQAGHVNHLYGSFDVLPSQHADTAQVVVLGANSIRNLGYGFWEDTDEQLLKYLAEKQGYRL